MHCLLKDDEYFPESKELMQEIANRMIGFHNENPNGSFIKIFYGNDMVGTPISDEEAQEALKSIGLEADFEFLHVSTTIYTFFRTLKNFKNLTVGDVNIIEIVDFYSSLKMIINTLQYKPIIIQDSHFCYYMDSKNSHKVAKIVGCKNNNYELFIESDPPTRFTKPSLIQSIENKPFNLLMENRTRNLFYKTQSGKYFQLITARPNQMLFNQIEDIDSVVEAYIEFPFISDILANPFTTLPLKKSTNPPTFHKSPMVFRALKQLPSDCLRKGGFYNHRNDCYANSFLSIFMRMESFIKTIILTSREAALVLCPILINFVELNIGNPDYILSLSDIDIGEEPGSPIEFIAKLFNYLCTNYNYKCYYDMFYFYNCVSDAYECIFTANSNDISKTINQFCNSTLSTPSIVIFHFDKEINIFSENRVIPLQNVTPKFTHHNTKYRHAGYIITEFVSDYNYHYKSLVNTKNGWILCNDSEVIEIGLLQMGQYNITDVVYSTYNIVKDIQSSAHKILEEFSKMYKSQNTYKFEISTGALEDELSTPKTEDVENPKTLKESEKMMSKKSIHDMMELCEKKRHSIVVFSPTAISHISTIKNSPYFS